MLLRISDGTFSIRSTHFIIYFNYFLKNIPVTSRTSYKLQLIDKIEKVIKRMRWKAHSFLNNKKKQGRSKTWNFWIQIEIPSRPTEKIDNFEEDLFNVVPSLKFKILNDNFQEKMKSDILDIKSSPNVLIFADKTSIFVNQLSKNIISYWKII